MHSLSIHTLGPTGTSSEDSARYVATLLPCVTVDVVLHPSFETACLHAQRARDGIFLVANAYVEARSFYMAAELRLLGCFIRDTPRYGVAVRAEAGAEVSWRDQAPPLAIVSHPSPIPLFRQLAPSELASRPVQFHMARSTSEAAQLVRQGSFDLCITNESSALHYRLDFIGRTVPITMVWSLFCAAERFESLSSLFATALPCTNPAVHGTAAAELETANPALDVGRAQASARV